MSILYWIILGVVAGWLATKIIKTSTGLIGNLVLGVVGAFIGGLIMNLIGKVGVTGFNPYSLLVATVGAVVLIYIGKLIRK